MWGFFLDTNFREQETRMRANQRKQSLETYLWPLSPPRFQIFIGSSEDLESWILELLWFLDLGSWFFVFNYIAENLRNLSNGSNWY